jgi:heat shock protein HslJ
MTDPSEGPAIAGTGWQLEAINDVEAPGDGRPTIEFHTDGTVSGSAGVNRFMGTWTQAVDLVEFAPLAVTRMAGSSEAMDLETRFLAVLSGRCRAAVDGDRLTLGGESGWLGLSRIAPG